MSNLKSLQTKFRSLNEKTAEVHRIMRSSQYSNSHPEAKLSLEHAKAYFDGAVLAFTGKSTDYSDYDRVEALQELCEECLAQALSEAIKTREEQQALVDSAKKSGGSCI